MHSQFKKKNNKLLWKIVLFPEASDLVGHVYFLSWCLRKSQATGEQHQQRR